MKIVRSGRIELPAVARDRSTRLTVRIKTTNYVEREKEREREKNNNE